MQHCTPSQLYPIMVRNCEGTAYLRVHIGKNVGELSVISRRCVNRWLYSRRQSSFKALKLEAKILGVDGDGWT